MQFDYLRASRIPTNKAFNSTSTDNDMRMRQDLNNTTQALKKKKKKSNSID